jgi:hypothetical protein
MELIVSLSINDNIPNDPILKTQNSRSSSSEHEYSSARPTCSRSIDVLLHINIDMSESAAAGLAHSCWTAPTKIPHFDLVGCQRLVRSKKRETKTDKKDTERVMKQTTKIELRMQNPYCTQNWYARPILTTTTTRTFTLHYASVH